MYVAELACLSLSLITYCVLIKNRRQYRITMQKVDQEEKTVQDSVADGWAAW